LHTSVAETAMVGEPRKVAASNQLMAVGTYARQDSYPCVMALTVQQGSKDDLGMKEPCRYDEPNASVNDPGCRGTNPLQ
jgi:hypothetical protein